MQGCFLAGILTERDVLRAAASETGLTAPARRAGRSHRSAIPATGQDRPAGESGQTQSAAALADRRQIAALGQQPGQPTGGRTAGVADLMTRYRVALR